VLIGCASGTVLIGRASGTVLIGRASGTVLIGRASGTVLIGRASGTTGHWISTDSMESAIRLTATTSEAMASAGNSVSHQYPAARYW